MKKVTIVDYGIGNLLSVRRAFEYCGADVEMADSPTVIAKAERLVLPGVGAFTDGMKGLANNNLVDAIRDYSAKNSPFMGICLGMQMMLDSSEEFGFHKGLGLIPGSVVRIGDKSVDGVSHKIPHIGWNSLLEGQAGAWRNTILHQTLPGESAYFVHSFTPVPCDEKHRLADCEYGGLILSAVIQSGYLYGCQFHPEKSGQVGLRIIESFLKL